MARRFNLDVDMGLPLEGYGFESRFVTLFDIGLDFEPAFNPNIAPQTLFSDSYAAFAPSDIMTPLNEKKDSPLEAPQLPGQPLYNGAFGATFELSSLLAANGGDGSLGFAINGIASGDGSGKSVSSVGDINGDGFDDFIIGAHLANPNGNTNAGESYVVFGNPNGFAAGFDLSSLNGTNGFIINGIDTDDRSGTSVSDAGDINGDGFDDFIIGAYRADPNGMSSGESYLVFGNPNGFSATFELSSLNGTNGFVLNGIAPIDTSGYSVSSAGDVNGDGFDDILISARTADPNGNDRAGETYVVFGSNVPFSASFELSSLNGMNGFTINGVDPDDISGASIASAGDFNGDGFDDLLIGAHFADPGGIDGAGETYIVYGTGTFTASFDLSSLNGTNGFVVNGIDLFDLSGGSVSSAGDVNGDGFDDIIIGASFADPNGNYSGESYVILGTASSLGASFDLSSLDGMNGFVINGMIDDPDRSLLSVSSAGDVNGDGFDDMLIGIYRGHPDVGHSGEGYIVFGQAGGFTANLELSSLNGTNGFIINGINESDLTGNAVSSAGDINGDGFDDILIGAFGANNAAGESYVIYGQANSAFELSSLLAANGGDGSAGSIFIGAGVSNSLSGYSVSSAGDVNGDGFDDIIIGAPNARISGSAVGGSYVVFGTDTGFGSSFLLSSLDGTNGFSMNGTQSGSRLGSRFGSSVSSAGDINGDGFDDLIIGAPNARNAAYDLYVGETYVVLGGNTGFPANLDLETLDGTNGFVITGLDPNDRSGVSVSSAGDINGDGFDDVLVGTASGNPNGIFGSGETYVIFGADQGFGASFNPATLDGTNGFVINGIDEGDLSGWSVSYAGDINGDGFADILIGAFAAEPNGVYSGESYVVFGNDTGFGASLDLSSLNGANGFVINGVDAEDQSGRSLSAAGDINGDGFDDLIIGARRADPNGSNSGESYVVFGSGTGFSASLDLSSLNGNDGFVIRGIDPYDSSGIAVSSAGDINGDGFDDILIGAYTAGSSQYDEGETYVIFGTNAGFNASFELSSLNGKNGFIIRGVNRADASGTSVSSAGDVNGDGYDDILTGAPRGASFGDAYGETYIVYGAADFGRTVEILSVSDDSYTASDAGEVVYGLAGNDVINGGAASDVLLGDEGDDTLNGSAGNDRLEGSAGNDALDGGDGNDTAVYNGNLSDYDIVNNGDSTYTVTDNVNGNGVDTLTNIEDVQIGTELIDLSTIISGLFIDGTAGNDSLLDTVDGDIINGLAGNDILDGLAGDDQINGGEGADRIIGGEGADANSGGAGFDSVDYRGAASGVRFNVDTGGTVGEAAGDTFSGIERYYLSDFNDIITGSDANEFFYGEDGNDQINGGGGIDRIFGGDGNDIQRGQEGNDTLYGSAGADQLNGGTGFDIANYRLAGAAVTVNMLSGGTVGDAAGDSYFGIEAVYGSNFDDSLTGNNSVNELRGGDGDDALFGFGGNDRFFGGEGADAFDGGSGIDIVSYALATLAVRVDLVTGGYENEAIGDSYISIEWVFGSEFSDEIFGDDAANRLEGRGGNNLLDGRGGNDRLIGGDGTDDIFGGDGIDTIFGRGGADFLYGEAGNDFFFGSDGGDVIDGGADFDTVSYLASSSGVVINLDFGGTGGDADGDNYDSIERVFGTSFDDSITGSYINDVLLGNGGSDYLDGGEGNDSLIGGAGTDSFGYDTTDGGADVISDFFGGETIFVLGGNTDFDTWAEVQAVGTDAGANVIFDFGGGNTLTIVGRNLADLDAGNFDFSGTPPASEPLSDTDTFAEDIGDVFDMVALI